MSKLEDNLNDILGIEKESISTEEFKAPAVRKEDKTKDDMITIMLIVGKLL